MHDAMVVALAEGPRTPAAVKDTSACAIAAEEGVMDAGAVTSLVAAATACAAGMMLAGTAEGSRTSICRVEGPGGISQPSIR